MTRHTLNVFAALLMFVNEWESDRHPDVVAYMDKLEHPRERDWFCDLLDAYLVHTPHLPPPSEEAKAFIAALIAKDENSET